MRRAWRRSRRDAVDDVVDLTDDETVDLRSGATASTDDYHCMTIHLNVPPVRDEAAEAWAQASSLIDYPADLEEWRADRRREDLQPGHLSAAVLQADESEIRD